MSKIRDCKEQAKDLLVNMGRGGASKEEMEQVLARFHVSLGNFFGV